VSDDQESLPKRLERYEETLIRETLAAHGGNVQETIKALGIPRKTFYDKMQRHGITRADYRSNE
jgi:two-component system C4-dicarboxylate transport response regulator DctD